MYRVEANTLAFATEGVERLRLSNTGNGGSAQFTGPVNIAEYLLHTADADTYVRFQNNKALLYGGGSGIVVDNGNVGIGNTSPTQKLQVDGNILLTTAGTHKLMFTNSAVQIDRTGGHLMRFEAFAGYSFKVNGSEKMSMNSSGDVTFTGKISATSKSFLINHPTKDNKKLQYASLEGPENGVYIRGKFQGGKYQDNIIDLPDYWVGLVHEDSITINLTPIGKYQESVSYTHLTLPTNREV